MHGQIEFLRRTAELYGRARFPQEGTHLDYSRPGKDGYFNVPRGPGLDTTIKIPRRDVIRKFDNRSAANVSQGAKLPEGCIVGALVKRESFSSVWLPRPNRTLLNSVCAPKANASQSTWL